MALTKQQWKTKLKRLVPSWVFERVGENEAIWSAMAAILEAMQQDIDQHVKETFIDQASQEYVELQGDERSIGRLLNETLGSYRNRVKRIGNQANLPDLKAIVDGLLIKGESTFIEHTEKAGNFFNREAFIDRDIIDFEVLYNAFTIIIDLQKPDATSFYNREAFLNREFLSGSNTSLDSVAQNIVNAVNKNKAYGTVCRLIERAS